MVLDCRRLIMRKMYNLNLLRQAMEGARELFAKNDFSYSYFF